MSSTTLRCPYIWKILLYKQEAGANGVIYPNWEREQHEDQGPHLHSDRQAQASSTLEYPSNLVEPSAPDQSPHIQDLYFVYQQSDRYSEQATGEGFEELVPVRPQLKPASTLVQAPQVSGFQGCHQDCLMEVTNHDQNRAVEHPCTVLEQEQRFSLCYQPHNRQVSWMRVTHRSSVLWRSTQGWTKISNNVCVQSLWQIRLS